MNLAAIFRIKKESALLWEPLIEEACKIYDINTIQRKACFLAQIGHESGCLRYTKEIWGPTKQQLKYEPGTKLAKMLGNNQPGDGKRYMGRGLIQTTGRANYERLTRRLKGPDFVKNPELLERPLWAVMSAGDYWKMRDLNNYADAYDFAGLTKRINGGLTGLAERQLIYNRAYAVLVFGT